MPTINYTDIGIIAPFNNQVNALREKFKENTYTIDTIHKFQGKENDCIILSTVEDKIIKYDNVEITDFLNNPNLLNVAISRAKKKLYLLASDELLNQEGTIINDLYKYFNYYCNEQQLIKSNVYSVFDLMFDDYSKCLEDFNKKLIKKSDFKSENIVATIINNICNSGEYGLIDYKFNYPLKYVIKKDIDMTNDEIRFVNNLNTHCDFIIFNKLNKQIILNIEVDGKQHNKEPQKSRDKIKDTLLLKSNINQIRISTTSIDCEEKIKEKLQKYKL